MNIVDVASAAEVELAITKYGESCDPFVDEAIDKSPQGLVVPMPNFPAAVKTARGTVALVSQSCKSAVAPAAPFITRPTVPTAVSVKICEAPAIVVRPDIAPFAVILVTPVNVPPIARFDLKVPTPAFVTENSLMPVFEYKFKMFVEPVISWSENWFMAVVVVVPM